MGFGSFVKKAVGGTIGLATKGTIKGLKAGAGALGIGGTRGGEGAAHTIGKFGTTPAESQKFRAQDFAQGLKFGKEQIGEGSLGRIGTDADVQAALQTRRQALGGLTGQEMQGQRDVATQRIQGQTESARRRLAAAQARSGVRGGTASAQQAGVIGQGIEAQAGFERDLMLQNRAAQQTAAGNLLTDVSGVRQFDLSQAARERSAQLQAGMGFTQLGVSERAGVAANQANVAAAQAQRPSGGLLGGVLGK
jgi:hypothetical protein